MDRDKKEFFKEQAEKFGILADRNPQRERLSVFNEWCESKDIEGKDKHYIWKIARYFKQGDKKEIEKGSEEAVRISELINAVFGADLERLKKIAEKKEAKKAE